MTLQLPIRYEQLVELVDQLSEEQQQDLMKRLLRRDMTRHAQQRPLTVEEKLRLLDAIKLDVAINEEPSIRRVDWYDDEGR